MQTFELKKPVYSSLPIRIFLSQFNGVDHFTINSFGNVPAFCDFEVHYQNIIFQEILSKKKESVLVRQSKLSKGVYKLQEAKKVVHQLKAEAVSNYKFWQKPIFVVTEDFSSNFSNFRKKPTINNLW
jgi:hypothetical protein